MRVVEIFRSIQGEGRKQGIPCVFLRLAGCNLACHWCDTEYARSKDAGVERSRDQVIETIWRMNYPHICITGGEPLLQKEELLPLLQSLHRLGKSVEIETNGTIGFQDLQPYASICMDVKCPLSGESSDISLLQYLTPNDSVKFVVQDIVDCVYAEEVIGKHRIAADIFISPVEGSDYKALADYVVDHALPARFQLQLHKIIGLK
ncbi:MAG: radical SAM protein [Methanoregulaceae archaeon]